MSTTIEIGDLLPPLRHTVTTFQLFRYSAVTWNPHRIHVDEHHARDEGHAGLALHSHLRAALALRAVTEGLGPEWCIAEFTYRLRRPLYAPVELTYTGRVTAVDADNVTLDVIEQNPAGDVGFEGKVSVTRTATARTEDRHRANVGAAT
jgi:hydroxyacyl-ACP dehydratase HTD2-like protein with hotdog domain